MGLCGAVILRCKLKGIEMAKYKISGVWENAEGVITHYAIHLVTDNSVARAEKTSKSAAVKLLTNASNEAVTCLWDYANSRWKDGGKVEVVSGSYLRSVHDSTVRDNLAHLIDYDWLKQ
jgi:hypothetical protein